MWLHLSGESAFSVSIRIFHAHLTFFHFRNKPTVSVTFLVRGRTAGLGLSLRFRLSLVRLLAVFGGMFPFNLTCQSLSLLDGLHYLACLSLYSARNGHTYLTTTMTSCHSSQLFCLLLLFPFCLMQSILLRLESLEQGECKWRDCYSIWGGWSSLNAQTLTSYAPDCHAVDIMPWVSRWASFSLSILVSTFRVCGLD